MSKNKILKIFIYIALTLITVASQSYSVEEIIESNQAVEASTKNSDKASNKKADKKAEREKKKTAIQKEKASINTETLNASVEKVKSITFEQIFNKAKEHSYDLKLANLDTQIAKTGIMGSRSEYFPKLYIYAGTEYNKNFKDDKYSVVSTVGDTFINPYTRFQSVFGVTLSYNLFDFGVRRGNLNRAKADVTAKELKEDKSLQELELTLIDTYTKALLTKHQLALYKEILDLDNKNLEMMQRLFDAQQISKTELNDRVVKVEKTKKSIAELNQMLDDSLSWLGFYTGYEFDRDNLIVADIPEPKFDPMEVQDYTKTVTWRYYEAEVKKKQWELKVTKRTNLPKVNVYSKYYMYGSDPRSYGKSFGDFGPSNWAIGGSVSMPVFDGLKNYSDIKRVNYELQQAMVQRDKAVAEWLARLSTMRSNLMWLKDQSEATAKIIDELTDKSNSKKRLKNSKLITPIEENDTKIELLEANIEYAKNSITQTAILNAIKTLVEY